MNDLKDERKRDEAVRGLGRPGLLWRIRSWIRYGTPLRVKLIVPVLSIALLVVGALSWVAFVSLYSSITSIYEQRARSVAAVISKSMQEKEYVLYYSEELDADIGRLLDRYESVVAITVVGVSARGFLVVASTDPTVVGRPIGEEESGRFEMLHEVEVDNVRLGSVSYLRAYHPLYSGPDLVGVVIVDMSLAEQAAYITRLSWEFGIASILGFLLLGGLLYIVLSAIVTNPIGRLAGAVTLIAQRKYDVEVPQPSPRVPGTPVRDEISELIDGFNLMTKVIHSHEQELRRMVVLDELTGVYNLSHLSDHLERELGKSKRYKHPTSLILIDVSVGIRDQKKRDEVLVRTATFLVSNLRNVDLIFRVAETRFAALLPETPAEGAAVAAERLRASAPDVASHFEFSVSLDISSFGWSGEDTPTVDEVLAGITGRKDLG